MSSSFTELYQGYKRQIKKKSQVLKKGFLYLKHNDVWRERVRLADPKNLSAQDEVTLAQLKKDNFHKADNLVDPKLLAELQAEAEKLIVDAENAPRSKNKNFWSQLIPRDVEVDNIFARFALQERILKLVGSYFGESPFLQDINLLASFGTNNETWQDSQLWHQDYGDSKVLKLWVYITDVLTPDDGPFTYLPGHASKHVPNPFQKRVSDETMVSLGFDKQAVAVTGPKGSSFLIDTRYCYHQGSRVELGHMRVAYVATYVSFASLSGSGNQVRRKNGELSRIQQLTLSRT